MDLVLEAIQSSEEIYRFTTETKVSYVFKTEKRKREGQLLRLVNKYVYKTKLEKLMARPYITSLLKREFQANIEELKKDQDLIERELPREEYDGADVQVLENRENWHPWQEELYKRFFYTSGEIKPAPIDDRKILFIYDEKGCSGKSTFFKWLYWKNMDDISWLSLGTTRQLKSFLCNVAHKKYTYVI
uniref:hypothetical protein n=1 Tax=Pseudo-nitzschia micropora TaxID=186175 RepID=UPI001D10E26C|nr:hypothetical protein KQ351_pgp077 [Pseudo-nitzschia micropora]UBA14926.1 hypothetical protein [Pseudo-nitzschia micropora]